MDTESRLYQLGLCLVAGVGTRIARALMLHTGSVSAIFSEKEASLRKIPGIGEKITANLKEDGILDRAKQEMEFIEKYHIQMVFFTDEAYPEELRQCPDAPLVLFYKGRLPAKVSPALSIVGTRNPSSRGKRLTHDWVQELAKSHPGLHIVSGLAQGIDITAHESALEHGLPTLAILGHGFHTLYPSAHRESALRIIQQGALVSDFFSNNLREPKNFIRRNRIIAGISNATLVMESNLKGGAMTTAEMASSYHRELFAVPGRPTDLRSIGCNHLIKSQQAILTTDPADISMELGWASKAGKKPSKKPRNLAFLSATQKQLLELLHKEPLNINELGALLQVHPAKLTGELLSLEFEGLIQAAPGGRFVAI